MFVVLPFVVCSAPLFAQPAGLTASDLRARKVIDDAIAALGGDTFLNMEDRVEAGRAYSFYNDELSGLSIAKIYTRYLTVAPGRTGQDLAVRERQAFGKNEDTATVLREDGAATVNWRGAKELPAEQFERYRDTTLRNILYILRIRLHEPGLLIESRGADVVDHLPVEVVDITDSENRVVTVYFHQSTKLPMKQQFSWRDPKTHDRNDEVTRFARYRETNGIQWPQEITRERNGDKIYQIFADSVAFNQNLTDDLFDTSAPVSKSSKRK
ncbi:MAG TPA: hypothetical protein VGR73_23185 [Bryobacteraceae bacterium]|nr:hypothetical protein [Bryobacteraceae bacterium]